MAMRRGFLDASATGFMEELGKAYVANRDPAALRPPRPCHILQATTPDQRTARPARPGGRLPIVLSPQPGRTPP
jgi:hypothetical protein